MAPTPSDALLRTVREFADTVLEHGRDEYGDESTPLFVDTLHVDSREPVPYPTAHRIRREHPDAVLANPATYQEFLRTLVGLTALTGDDRYRDAAAETVQYVFDELTGETGLVEWGGHIAHDLESDEVASWRTYHELKMHYPYYEFMWEIDPEATRRYVEAMWNAHIIDWATLDFDRHGRFDESLGPLWDHEYGGGEVFFMGEGLTFVNAGSDFYYAAAMLAAFTGDDAPLEWAERLARRYVETRQEPGISGYQFSSQRGKTADEGHGFCNLEGDRAEYQMGPFVHGDRLVLEGTLFKPKPKVQRRQLLIGDRLGDRGEAFTEWALEELRAWGEVAYRPDENTFEPILTDGHSMEGFVQRIDGYYGEKGTVVTPIPGHPEFLWTYAQAYRVSADPFHWQMARDLARGNDLGDIGTPEGDGVAMAQGTDHAHYQSVYGLLELYRATGREPYLETALGIGETLVEERFRDGLFGTDGDVALTGDRVPLALLHLVAAAAGEPPDSMPAPGGKSRWGSVSRSVDGTEQTPRSVSGGF